MTKISINNLVFAIYESSKDKSGEELENVLKNSVRLLSEKRSLGKSKKILSKLEEIVDKKNEIVRAKVHSTTEIKKKTIDEIEDFIKKRYKVKNVILDFEINERLLGGIKIEVGDEVIDLTLKNKIHKLKNYLINN